MELLRRYKVGLAGFYPIVAESSLLRLFSFFDRIVCALESIVEAQ